MDEEKKEPKPDREEKPESPAGEAAGPRDEPEKTAKPSSEPDSESEKKKPVPEKPAAAAAGKPAPGKPAAKPVRKPRPKRPARGPQYEDLDDEDELLAELRKRFPEAEIEGRSFLGQNIYEVPLDSLLDVMIYLRDEASTPFDYLIDATALDYLGDEKRFCLVYQLYAYPEGPLIRVKSRLTKSEVAPSVTSIWKTADWLEREVYDMFGIEFSGHPDLKRILLPEDWHGYPLRKDYDIKLQDQSWIRKHLRIRKVPN